jgi:hypothetical protein
LGVPWDKAVAPKQKKTAREEWEERQKLFAEMQAKQDKAKAQAIVDDIKRQMNS